MSDIVKCKRCGTNCKSGLCNMCYIELKDMGVSPRDYMKGVSK